MTPENATHIAQKVNISQNEKMLLLKFQREWLFKELFKHFNKSFWNAKNMFWQKPKAVQQTSECISGFSTKAYFRSIKARQS